jgi:hypothetical protein
MLGLSEARDGLLLSVRPSMAQTAHKTFRNRMRLIESKKFKADFPLEFAPAFPSSV